VIELSSFSKCCSPGCRLGWLVAPSALITQLSRRNEVTIQSVSGFSLAAMTAFLGAMPGGQLGFEDYLSGVAARVGYASAVAVPGHLVD
jgi:DNA-binding transcriptional MocR family regulator